MKGNIVKTLALLSFAFMFMFLGNLSDRYDFSFAYSSKVSNFFNASLNSNEELVGASLTSSVKTMNNMNSSTLYRDKIQYVEVTVNNAASVESAYTVKILNPNNTDDTGNWNIYEKSKTGNKLTIRFRRSGSYPIPGSYKVQVTNNRVTSSKTSVSFTVEGYYNYFELTEPKIINGTHGYANETNRFEIDLTGLADQMYNKIVGSGDISGISISIKYNDKDVTTSKFDVTQEKDKIYITNKRSFFNIPKSGTYEVTITHTSSDFKETTYSQKTTFKIGKRYIRLTDVDAESHRYIRQIVDKKYSMKITSLTSQNITYIISGTGKTTTIADFKKTYETANIDVLTSDEEGHITYKYSDDLIITNYNGTNITYTLGGTSNTLMVADFKAKYQDAYQFLVNNYEYDANGYLIYNLIYAVPEENKTIDPKNQNVFALSGGIITKTISYDGVRSEEFDNFSPYIVKAENPDTCQNGICASADGFTLTCKYSPVDDSTGQITCSVDYDNTKEKYTGVYKIVLPFEDAEEQSIKFEIYDQNTDYYLTSMFDTHAEKEDELPSSILPPSNQRYEYYLGLYLIKGGKKVDTRTAGSISTRIFDHHVEYETDETGALKKDSKGQNILKYYDVDSYQIKINSYNKATTKVNFDVTINGGQTLTNELTYAEFASKYQIDERFPTCGNNNFLECYKYDQNNNIITDDDNFYHTDPSGKNYKMVIKSFKSNAEGTDVDVVFDFYNESNVLQTKNKSMPLTTFKVQYPDIYNYLITKFIFDASGNIIRGTFMGEYKVYSINGDAIKGNEVTNKFNITVDYDDLTNVEKAVTILPKTEVDKGTYYVYTKYETMDAIGYINQNSVDPITGETIEATISKDLYPEMWLQNVHMTSISYNDPIYNLEVSNVDATNERNDKHVVYYNVDGNLDFTIKTKYIYSVDDENQKSRFDIKVLEKVDGSYVDATSKFVIKSKFVNPVDSIESSGTVNLQTIPGRVNAGDYKLVVEYKNNGVTGQCEKEFTISGKYYDIELTDETPLAFARNVEKTASINANLHFVSSPDNIVPSITRKIPGSTDEILILDKQNKAFKNIAGETIFRYDYVYHQQDSELTYYQFLLTNVKNAAEVGEYVLGLSYQEGDNELITSKLTFNVTKEEYLIELTNRTPKVNDDGMFIYYDISTKNIAENELDKIEYFIYYYDTNEKKYVDVSSADASTRMFKIRDNWDLSTGPDFKGKLIIELIQNTVDMKGTYTLLASYATRNVEYELTDYGKTLKSLFEWKISDVVITSKYNDNGNYIDVPGFYNNLNDVTIDVTLSSPYEKNASWVINKDCINGVCDPTSGTNYNNRFNDLNTTKDNQKLKLTLKDNLDSNLKLEEGKYALTLYYNSSDYKTYTFDVQDEYADIIFDKDNTLIYSKISNDQVSDGLFTNKVGKIYIPVRIYGIDYSNEDIQIKVLSEDGLRDYTSYFNFNRSEFVASHNLEINYDPTLKQIESGKYMVEVSYSNSKKTIKDSLTFTVNKTYFNFYFDSYKTDPNPLYPNAENGGKIEYDISTVDIPDIQISSSHIDRDSNKHVFSKNSKIFDAEDNDVTSNFKIYSTNSSTSLTSFILNVEYAKNSVEPGTYRLVTYYDMDGYRVEKTQTFDIGNYVKDFEIEKTEIMTDAMDGRLHNNVDSVFTIFIKSDYELFASDMLVKITSSKNVDVTDKFTVEKYDNQIRIKYDKNSSIQADNYVISLTYQENPLKSITKNVDYEMNSSYKSIILSNMISLNSIVYADQENMGYTFDVSTVLTGNDVNNIKARIYDAEDNILYSDIKEDNVTNAFNLENKIADEGKYYINIIPFKARVGEYRVQLYYYESDGSYSASNMLSFIIEKNYYNVSLSGYSKVEPVKNYGDNSIYDIDGAKGTYYFMTTYDDVDTDVYSIKVFDSLTLVDEIKVSYTSEDLYGNTFKKIDFKTNALKEGNLDFYLCINGLPYTRISSPVKKYIKVDELKVIIDNVKVDDNLTLFYGEFKPYNYVLNPSNHTDNSVTVTSTDEAIVKVLDDGRIKVNGIGSCELVFTHNDVVKKIKITARQRLTSNVYSINYDETIINVLSMNKKSLTRSEFLSNLNGVVTDYKILDKNHSDITSKVNEIGTGMYLQNGEETYAIVIIGDLNKDGKINVFDVSMLYNYVRGKTELDKYSLASAHIRKQNEIKVADVSKLYSFVRNRISGI